MAYNKVILHGRISTDIEVKATQSGANYCNFNLAVDRKFRSGEDTVTDFLKCKAWRSTADFIGRNFTKGQAAIVDGEIHENNYTDKDGNKQWSYEIVVDNITFGESKKSRGDNAASPAQDAPSADTEGFTEVSEDDSDLPF